MHLYAMMILFANIKRIEDDYEDHFICTNKP